MKIIAYEVSEKMDLVPSKPTRLWMDNSINKNPYRCLPLTMANSFGWDLISKSEVVVEWNGGQRAKDIKINKVSGSCFPVSHFGEGVITWHTGYLFVTEEPYGLYVTGPANEPTHNIIYLSGIVETYWLPFTFTMNWRFTAPGQITIKEGDVIAHIFPVKMDVFKDLKAEIKSIHSNPPLKQEYLAWSKSRAEFNSNPRNKGDWQKNYFKGSDLSGEKLNNGHRTNPNVPPFDHL